MDQWIDILTKNDKKIVTDTFINKCNEHLLMSIQYNIYKNITDQFEKLRYARTQKGISQMWNFMMNIKKCESQDERIIHVYNSEIRIEYHYENDHLFSLRIDDELLFEEQHNEYPLKTTDVDVSNIKSKLLIDDVSICFLKLLTF